MPAEQEDAVDADERSLPALGPVEVAQNDVGDLAETPACLAGVTNEDSWAVAGDGELPGNFAADRACRSDHEDGATRARVRGRVSGAGMESNGHGMYLRVCHGRESCVAPARREDWAPSTGPTAGLSDTTTFESDCGARRAWLCA